MSSWLNTRDEFLRRIPELGRIASHAKRAGTCRRRFILYLAPVLLLGIVPSGFAQPTTYHLHNEPSTNWTFQALKTQGPDVSAVILQSPDLKNQPPGSAIWRMFETNEGVPGTAGTIPANSTLTFTLWMRKTASFGVIAGSATVMLSDATPLCSVTTPALSTTITAYTLQCTTSSDIAMSMGDRLRVAVGRVITTGPGNKSVMVELRIEGTLNAEYDSRVVVPSPSPPAITNIQPASGHPGNSVQISGTNFGTSQGTSVVTFNGVPASPSSWTSTVINVPVPAGATSGMVMVSVGGISSNGVPFSVLPPAPSITSISPASAAAGEMVTITGANFQSTQGASTVSFNGVFAVTPFWSDSSISAVVPNGTSTGSVVVTAGGQTSNGHAFTVQTGTLSGTITRASDSAPLAGASVQAVLMGMVKGSATSGPNGFYSINSLEGGTYDVRIHATGYSSEVRSGTTIAGNLTTVVDVPMSQPGSISGTVTQADGMTPIAGAAVTLFAGGLEKASGSTGAAGWYSLAGLRPGGYTLQVVYVGYRTKEQGIMITEDANTVADLSLQPAPAGSVTYVYDELGRLVTVVDPSGDAATYSYDAVGNILSIGRIGAGTVAVTAFTPQNGPPGTTVTVYGTGFSSNPAENGVMFGGVAADVVSSTATQVVATVPAGALTGPIAVATPAGSGTAGTDFVVVPAPAAPSISSFSPAIVAQGAPLTIDGTHFDTVQANNRVTLNTMLARLTSVTETVISAIVQVGATSGRITVETPLGAAVSADDLYIPPPGYSVGNVEFTSRIAFGSGAALTVPISTANRIGLVIFDGVPGQRISLVADQSTVSPCGLSLLRPNGTSQATAWCGSGGGFLDAQTLVSPGTYTILVDPSGTGSVRLTLHDVPPDPVTSIVPGGPTALATTTVPGQRAILTFTGSTGQRVSLEQTGATFGPTGADVSVKGPSGSTLATNFVLSSAFLEVPPLSVDGTYTILVDPRESATGSITLKLHDASDVTGTITAGGDQLQVAITVPSQIARITFDAAQDQRISLHQTGATFGSSGADVFIRNPDGSTLTSNFVLSSAFVDTQVLATAGTYTIIVDPRGTGTGSLTLKLYDVPADAVGTIAPDGSQVPIATTTPGQNAAVTFEGSQGQRVSLRETSVTFGSSGADVFIRNPDGSTLASHFVLSSGFLEPVILPVSGTYTIYINPRSAGWGSITLQLFDVPPDVTGKLSVNGSDVLVPIVAPGQNASYTFSGKLNQQVTVRVTDSNFTSTPCVAVRLFRQNGTTQLASSVSCSKQFNLAPQTLPATETYIVRVDPGGVLTGSLRVSVTTP